MAPMGSKDPAPPYISLAPGRYNRNSPPTYVRYVTNLALLGSIQFLLSVVLCALGLAILAKGYEDLDNVLLSPAPPTTTMTPTSWTKGTTTAGHNPPATVSFAPVDRRLLGIVKSATKVWCPIWAGFLSAVISSIGLYTIYRPGTYDSMICYLFSSVLMTIAMSISGITTFIVVYEIGRDLANSSGAVQAESTVNIAMTLNGVACAVSGILAIFYVMSASFVCTSICGCGQRYMDLERWDVKQQNGVVIVDVSEADTALPPSPAIEVISNGDMNHPKYPSNISQNPHISQMEQPTIFSGDNHSPDEAL